LAIVKHLVLNHGGDISVDSTPGVGSEFRVRLPRPMTPTPAVFPATTG
jgi:signal transduction histidine kinase